MIAILFDSARRVQPARRFGLGLARALPSREKRVGYTAADAQWWAENSPANQANFGDVFPSDAELERMAEESYAMDLLCRGIVLA